VLLSACNSYERVLKSNDINYKLKKANEYYDKKQYPQANAIYENLIPVMKNTKNYELLYYRYAYSFYNMKDYLSASYHFKNFVDFFPTSKDAEECEFMAAICLYKMSPKPSLEQTYTVKALEALQSYINTHPGSSRIEEANKYVDECRKKIEEKQSSAAKLYFNIGQYRAASIAYQNVIRTYPESPLADYYQYMVVRSWYQYAKSSVEEKQEERYATALNAYQELVDTYPQSSYLREAEKFYTEADHNLKKLRNEHK
jgi:outer membrane protein assembly factor BamD